MDITTIFNSFAFPTAVVIAIMWFVVWRETAHANQIQKKDEMILDLVKMHKEETSKFTEAIDRSTEGLSRNTVVVERLCTMLGDKEGTT